MLYGSKDEMAAKVGSVYKLVILAARRTLELNEGKPQLTDAPPNTKLGSIAIKEIDEGKIGWKVKEVPKE